MLNWSAVVAIWEALGVFRFTLPMILLLSVPIFIALALVALTSRLWLWSGSAAVLWVAAGTMTIRADAVTDVEGSTAGDVMNVLGWLFVIDPAVLAGTIMSLPIVLVRRSAMIRRQAAAKT